MGENAIVSTVRTFDFVSHSLLGFYPDSDPNYSVQKSDYLSFIKGTLHQIMNDPDLILPSHCIEKFFYILKQIDHWSVSHNDDPWLLFGQYDELTALPNRRFFQHHVDRMIQSQTKPFSILFMDLDDFKLINDRFGHNVGDWLLKEVALRLKETVRQDDMVGRYGGDEFVILVNDGNAVFLVDRILEALSSPFFYDQTPLYVMCSIGVSTCSHDDITYEDLIKKADKDMYRIKKERKNL